MWLRESDNFNNREDYSAGGITRSKQGITAKPVRRSMDTEFPEGAVITDVDICLDETRGRSHSLIFRQFLLRCPRVLLAGNGILPSFKSRCF